MYHRLFHLKKQRAHNLGLEIEGGTDASLIKIIADRIPRIFSFLPGMSLLGASTPADAIAERVDSREVKSTLLRPSGTVERLVTERNSSSHLLQRGGSSPSISVPTFTGSEVRPDRSAAESNSTRSRNSREGSTSNHNSKINIPSHESNLQRCKQALPDGTSCQNLYQRTRRRKMCTLCYRIKTGAPSSCSGSVIDESETLSVCSEQEEEADIRIVKIYTKGARIEPSRTRYLPYMAAATAPLLLLLDKERRKLGAVALLAVGAFFTPRDALSRDGGSRRDPRLHDSYSNVVDDADFLSAPLLPYTKDEMLYLGHGGYVMRPVNWDILVSLRSKKRVKTTKSNAKAVLAHILHQYPKTELSLARDTAAYFLQELQQDEIYFDHHTVLVESGAPPSYPDGHWRS